MKKTNNKIIEFNNVKFSYGDNLIIDSVNFSVNDDEFIGIVGPNGGGKTTLLKLLLGILTPDSGTISVLNQSAISARKQIGYMPQYLNFDMKFPATVMDVVLMARLKNKVFGFYSKKDKNQAMQALEKVDIANLATKTFSELSGGQKQRVLIARALACEPKILLLDEPTASVDPGIENQFYELLKVLSSEITIISVSHDLGFIMNIVDKVICVNRKLHIHPVTEFDDNLLGNLYNSKNYSLVRHDHCCNHDECEH